MKLGQTQGTGKGVQPLDLIGDRIAGLGVPATLAKARQVWRDDAEMGSQIGATRVQLSLLAAKPCSSTRGSPLPPERY